MKKKILLAVGFSVIACAALWFYTRSLETEVVGGKKVLVLVANAKIAAGARLERTQLAVREVPQSYVHQSAILKGEEDQVVGRKVGSAIEQGQPLLWTDFDMGTTSTVRRLSQALPKGQRALTINVDTSSSVAGHLRPGDHIDLLGTFARGGQQGGEFATITLLQNVLILATGSSYGSADDQRASGYSNITLSVDLESAELILFAAQRGPLGVVLRAADDIDTVEGIPDKNFSDIFEAPKRAALQRRYTASRKIKALVAQ